MQHACGPAARKHEAAIMQPHCGYGARAGRYAARTSVLPSLHKGGSKERARAHLQGCAELLPASARFGAADEVRPGAADGGGHVARAGGRRAVACAPQQEHGRRLGVRLRRGARQAGSLVGLPCSMLRAGGGARSACGAMRALLISFMREARPAENGATVRVAIQA